MRAAASRAARREVVELAGVAAPATTSGQFLVRMVWSGVITPPSAVARKLVPLTKFRTPALPRKSSDEPAPGAFDLSSSEAARAAHDRRDLGERGDLLRQPARSRAPPCGGAR